MPATELSELDPFSEQFQQFPFATLANLRIFRGSKRVAGRRVELKPGLNRLRLPALPSGTYRLTLGAREAVLVI